MIQNKNETNLDIINKKVIYATFSRVTQRVSPNCTTFHLVAKILATDIDQKLDLKKIEQTYEYLDENILYILNVEPFEGKTPEWSGKKISFSDSLFNTYSYIRMTNEHFFNESSFIEKILLKNDPVAKFFIYRFEREMWSKLLLQFREKNIFISGGSLTKRHIISPIEIRLNMFAIAAGFHKNLINNYYTLDRLVYSSFLDLHDKKKDIPNLVVDFEKLLINNINLRYNKAQENITNNNQENNNTLIDEKDKTLIEDKNEIPVKDNNINTSIEIKNNSDKLNNSPFNSLGQKREFHFTSYFRNIRDKKENNQNIDLAYNIYNKNKNKNNIVANFLEGYINNPIFFDIRKILNIKELTNFQKQLKIEESLKYFWKDEILLLFKNNKKLFSSGYGLSLLKDTIITLKKDIEDLKENKIYLHNKKYKHLILLLDNADIIAIVLKNVIPFCIKYESINKQNVVNLVEKIGKEIQTQTYLNEWLKYSEIYNYKKEKETCDLLPDILINKENLYYIDLKNIKSSSILKINYKKSRKGLIFEEGLTEVDFLNKIKNVFGELSENDLKALGLYLLVFISDKSKLFYVEEIFIDKETIRRLITPGPNLNKEIFNIITYDTDLLPMVNTPEPWVLEKIEESKPFSIETENKINPYDDSFEKNYTIKNFGGFIFNNKNKNDLIRKSHRNICSTNIFSLDLVNTVNYISSVKYCINNEVLKYIFNLLENNDNKINSFIKLNLHPKTKDIYKLTTYKNLTELQEVLKHNSQFYSDNNVLQTALLFSNWTEDIENSIYFPLFVEWRGRLFTNSGFFSYQQGELARSLLLFKEGEVLNSNGIKALKIYTANCFGLNKLSHIQRIEWVDSNIKKIIEIEPNFIFQAEEPLLFLACAYELKGYYNDPENFISRLPIYLNFYNNISKIDKNTEICLIIHADFCSKFKNKSKIKIVNSKIGKRFYSSTPTPNNKPNSLCFIAVVIYQNVETHKGKILIENKNRSGVYRWTNLTNNKSYIGSSINLTRRFYEYFNLRLLKLKSSNSIIYSSLLKNGHSNFKLEILEYCGSLNILKREQFFIDLLKPEYNICKTAGSTLGRKMTEKTKRILLAANKGRKLTKEHIKKISNSLKGRLPWNTGKKLTLTVEQKLKRSESVKGSLNPFFGKNQTEDTIIRINARRFGLNNKERRYIIVKNIETGEINKFISFNKAAKHFNTYDTKISRYVKSKKIFEGKYQFYIEIEKN